MNRPGAIFRLRTRSGIRMSDKKPCLVVFCRKPRRGIGKQRLAAAIGEDAAGQVAAALWDCVREDLAEWQGDAVLAVADAEEETWGLAELAARNHPQ